MDGEQEWAEVGTDFGKQPGAGFALLDGPELTSHAPKVCRCWLLHGCRGNLDVRLVKFVSGRR